MQEQDDGVNTDMSGQPRYRLSALCRCLDKLQNVMEEMRRLD